MTSVHSRRLLGGRWRDLPEPAELLKTADRRRTDAARQRREAVLTRAQTEQLRERNYAHWREAEKQYWRSIQLTATWKKQGLVSSGTAPP
jgi:hypothetical protein